MYGYYEDTTLAILNKPLDSGQTVSITGRYKWKNLARLRDDNFTYQVQLPTHHLGVKIVFPSGFPSEGEKLQPVARLSHTVEGEEVLVLQSPALTSLDSQQGKISVCSECYNLKPDYAYSVDWSVSK